MKMVAYFCESIKLIYSIYLFDNSKNSDSRGLVKSVAQMVLLRHYKLDPINLDSLSKSERNI